MRIFQVFVLIFLLSLGVWASKSGPRKPDPVKVAASGLAPIDSESPPPIKGATKPIKVPKPAPKPPIVVEPSKNPDYICTKKIKVVVSAYSPNDPRQGTGWGTTSGRHASHPGVAVDPKVIPLGSVVVVNGRKYLADDTGNGVKGRHVDLRVTSRGAAIKWGRRHMVVKVYKKVSK